MAEGTTKKMSTGTIIGIVVAVIAAISTAVYFLFIKKSSAEVVASVDPSMFVSQQDHDTFYSIIDICNQDPYFNGGNSGWNWVIPNAEDRHANPRAEEQNSCFTDALVNVLNTDVGDNITDATRQAYYVVYNQFKSQQALSSLH